MFVLVVLVNRNHLTHMEGKQRETVFSPFAIRTSPVTQQHQQVRAATGWYDLTWGAMIPMFPYVCTFPYSALLTIVNNKMVKMPSPNVTSLALERCPPLTERMGPHTRKSGLVCKICLSSTPFHLIWTVFFLAVVVSEMISQTTQTHPSQRWFFLYPLLRNRG